MIEHLKRPKMIGSYAQFFSFLIFLAVWELSTIVLSVPSFLLPPPSAVAIAIYQDLASGLVLGHFYVTLSEVIFGFCAATVVGVALGSAIGLFPRLGNAIYPLVLALQTIPKIALAPLFVIWFGFGPESKIITVATVVVFPVLVNVIAGIRTVDSRRLLMMRSLNATKRQTYWKIQFPSFLPFLFAGLEVAIVLSVTGAVVSEFIGSSVGLGSLILMRQSNSNVAGVFSALFYLTIMGLALHWLLTTVGHRYTKWSLTQKNDAK